MKFWKKLVLFIITMIAIVLSCSRHYIVKSNFLHSIENSKNQNMKQHMLEKYMLESNMIKNIQLGEGISDENIVEYLESLYQYMENNSEFVAIYNEAYEKIYSNINEIDQVEIKEILNEVRKKLKLQKKYIMGHYRNNVIKVDIQNILYIENAKRGSKVTVCKDCIESEFNAPILVDEKLEMLIKKHFELVFAHRSYIINMVHIEKIVHNLAFLDNGEQLSISRTYQKHIREQFTKYLADNN